jgi:hypothetical protein
MHTEHGGGVPESTTFSQELSALKREGSNILLVGDETDATHVCACRRLLGNASDDPRHRLLVFTEEYDACERLSDGVGDSARVIFQQVDGPSDHSCLEESVVHSRLLSALGKEIIASVDEFEEGSDGLDPAELRICVDSLAPLLDEHAPENVFRLLHMVTSRVRQASGMGHFHLNVDRDDDAVHLLEPLFDAIVEVRTDGETTEHRWHLRDREVSSGWIDLG